MVLYSLLQSFQFSFCGNSCNNNCPHTNTHLNSSKYAAKRGKVCATSSQSLVYLQDVDIPEQGKFALRNCSALKFSQEFNLEPYLDFEIKMVVDYWENTEDEFDEHVFVHMLYLYVNTEWLETALEEEETFVFLEILAGTLQYSRSSLMSLQIFRDKVHDTFGIFGLETNSGSRDEKLLTGHMKRVERNRESKVSVRLPGFNFQTILSENLVWNFSHRVWETKSTKLSSTGGAQNVDPHAYATASGSVLNVFDVQNALRQLVVFLSSASTNVSTASSQGKTLIVVSYPSTATYLQTELKGLCALESDDLETLEVESNQFVIVTLEVFKENRVPDYEARRFSHKCSCGHPPFKAVLQSYQWERVVFTDWTEYATNLVKGFEFPPIRSKFRWGIARRHDFNPELGVSLHRFLPVLLQFCYSEQFMDSLFNFASCWRPDLHCPQVQTLLRNCLLNFVPDEFVPKMATGSTKVRNLAEIRFTPTDQEHFLVQNMIRGLDATEKELFWVNPQEINLNQMDLIQFCKPEEFDQAFIQPLLLRETHLTENIKACKKKILKCVSQLRTCSLYVTFTPETLLEDILESLREVNIEVDDDVKESSSTSTSVNDNDVENHEDSKTEEQGGSSSFYVNGQVGNLILALTANVHATVTKQLKEFARYQTALKQVAPLRKFGQVLCDESKRPKIDVCPICFDRPASVFLAPCFHFFCRRCLVQAEPDHVKKCPCCKKKAGSNTEIFSVDTRFETQSQGFDWRLPAASLVSRLITTLNDQTNCLIVCSGDRVARCLYITLLEHTDLPMEFWMTLSRPPPDRNCVVVGMEKNQKIRFGGNQLGRFKRLIVVGGGHDKDSINFNNAKKNFNFQKLTESCHRSLYIDRIQFPSSLDIEYESLD